MVQRTLKNPRRIAVILVIMAFSITLANTMAHEKIPFAPGATYNPDIPTPESVLGFEIGSRPVRYDEATDYLKILVDASPKLDIFYTGKTHEHRKLYNLLVSSEENLKKAETIRGKIGKLADPRKLDSRTEADQIIDNTPAIAWMMYNVHGNELSGADAAVFLAYHLAASTGETTTQILDNLIIGIDPFENPDGRERTLAQLQQWTGNVPTSDTQSLVHSGFWPGGRTNHYLFDMNRDWFILSQPETQARVKTLVKWHPQLVVDAHEMGSFSTFFFNPPREPISLHIPKTMKKWWKMFSKDQAKAFDQFGWSYYTADSFDEWYPGYGSSWPYFIGAVAILYEQARTSGAQVKQPQGTTLTFREAVHHQFISSLSNLTTTALNRKEFLTDFYATQRLAVQQPKKGAIQAYMIDPTKNQTRARHLVEKLIMQGIEVKVADKEFRTSQVKSYWDSSMGSKRMPAGTYIINMAQPMKQLITAVLEFDPRLTNKLLQDERTSLEKGEGTRMYEVGAWSPFMAYDVDAYASMNPLNVQSTPVEDLAPSPGELINPDPSYGYIIDSKDDGSVLALSLLLEKGFKVHAARKPFAIAGQSFHAGSYLLRVQANPTSLKKMIEKIVDKYHVKIVGVNTALAEKGPDLGNSKFRLLESPRIGLISGPGVSTNNFGALWYLLDYELRCRHSVLDISNMGRLDLRKYNVLIIPTSWGGPSRYRQLLGKSGIRSLKDWVSDGGTLIGIGNAATFLADSASGMSKVRLRRQSLKQLDAYEKAYDLEVNVGQMKIDSLSIWEKSPVPEAADKKAGGSKSSGRALAAKDARQRLFMPQGAMLRVDLNREHWLNFGLDNKVPALVYTSYAFLSKRPVETPARLAAGKNLRISGLLWPEARARWEKSSYATRESMGRGQIILFSNEPNFRAYFYGTTRMLLNAILYGPGFGSRAAVDY